MLGLQRHRQATDLNALNFPATQPRACHQVGLPWAVGWTTTQKTFV
jgi:hypothetical protein